MNPTTQLNNFLGCRISTEDRMKAEALKSEYKVRNHSELMRALISEKAAELGV